MWVRDLADADASCGGKAANLARLLAHLDSVPAGFVIETGAFRFAAGPRLDVLAASLHAPSDDLHARRRQSTGQLEAIGHELDGAAGRIAKAELPAELVREVEARAAALGPLLAVRSSATIEDGEAGAAAGVYSSRRAVPLAELWEAIRAVWTSALTPLAATYARRRGGPIAIAVIVQRFVEGEPLTIYTRLPGNPTADEIVMQRGDQLVRGPRWPALDRRPAFARAAELARRAEEVLGAVGSGVDVELIERGSELAVVQARPIVHPTLHARAPAPPPVLAPLVADGRVWTWDVAHNPDPLSVAQQQLVELVDRDGCAPYEMRVCAGYLYTTPSARERPVIRDAATLAAEAAALEAGLAQILDAPAPQEPVTVADALARFVAFYRIWAGELSPLVAAARAVLPDTLRARGEPAPDSVAAKLVGRRRSAVDAMLIDVALGVMDEATLAVRLGVMAPAWDVCVPTFAERPALVRDAIDRTRLVTPAATGPVAVDGALERELQIARVAADLAERDDLWFARAQWLVRRALLAKARERSAQLGDDIFWLPLDAAIDDLDDARRRAAGARAAAERASRWDMPVVVNGPPPMTRTALRGVGTGPRVAGRVVRFASLASAITVGRGDVIVVRAVTPALAVLVVGCAALVSETGGLLDHGAALARELGIPCVVGCHDAWSRLADGALVMVDGDAGTVETST